MRRTACLALLLALAVAAPPAHAKTNARCGEPIDSVGQSLPEPARSVYLRFCGV